MRGIRIAIPTLLVVALGGCAAPSPRVGPPRPSLVMVPQALPGSYGTAAPGWEDSRADASLGVDRSSGLAALEVVEIRTRDHRRTQNGRVSESSRTITRSRRLGVLLAP